MTTWAFWGELFLRSALLLAAMEGVRRLSKPLTARRRHLIVLTGLGLLAALPVLSFILPPIHLMNFFAPPVHARVTVTTSLGAPSAISPSSLNAYSANWPLLFWLSGAIVMLLPPFTGRLLLMRVLRRAAPLRDPAWLKQLHALTDELGMPRKPRLMIMSDSAVPLAFGLVRPTILLPAECRQWTELRRRIVLLHELTHIRRRDTVWQLFANVVAAVWWFQPLAWFARRRLRQESEYACDTQVLDFGVRPSDYAAQLVDLARASRQSLPWQGAICIARKDELEPRLIRILAPHTNARLSARLFLSIALISAIAAMAPAITLSKNHSHTGVLTMKKALFSSLLASATLSAATISGSLFDTTGVAIPDAKLVLHSADTSADLDGASSPDGKFSFSDLAAGQYILRVEKPGFAELLREFTVKQDSTVERGLVMQIKESNAGEEASGSVQPFAPDRIRVKGEVAQANLIHKVQPVYPAAAKAAHVQGTVMLQAAILKDGTLGEITVASSPSPDLSEASIEAVRQWRYRPILLNGQPVEVLTYVKINFTLSQ